MIKHFVEENSLEIKIEGHTANMDEIHDKIAEPKNSIQEEDRLPI